MQIINIYLYGEHHRSHIGNCIYYINIGENTMRFSDSIPDSKNSLRTTLICLSKSLSTLKDMQLNKSEKYRVIIRSKQDIMGKAFHILNNSNPNYDIADIINKKMQSLSDNMRFSIEYVDTFYYVDKQERKVRREEEKQANKLYEQHIAERSMYDYCDKDYC